MSFILQLVHQFPNQLFQFKLDRGVKLLIIAHLRIFLLKVKRPDSVRVVIVYPMDGSHMLSRAGLGLVVGGGVLVVLIRVRSLGVIRRFFGVCVRCLSVRIRSLDVSIKSLGVCRVCKNLDLLLQRLDLPLQRWVALLGLNELALELRIYFLGLWQFLLELW
jgi:hypothetical protein